MHATSRNILDPAVRRDPWPFFARLREAPPVFSEPPGMWLVARYDDVIEAVRQPAVFSSVAMKRQQPGDEERGVQNVITTDPPVHTRLRSVLQHHFTNRSLKAFQPRIEAICDDYLARMTAKDRFELVSEFTIPFPIGVIAELLGIEPERREDFKRWSDALVRVLGESSGPAWERARAGVYELIEFFRGTVDRRRREEVPADDLLGVLIQAERDERLSAKEILGYCTLLLAAGNETTTNLVGGMVLALLQNPEQLEILRADPALVPNAVEEGLRYCSPVQGIYRRATRDAELGGAAIRAGQDLALLYGSANHDPAKFPDPERFDVTRNTGGHLGFGQGVHHCLGAHLARREARAALERLLPLLPQLTCRESEVRWGQVWFIRGPEQLPLARAA